MSLIAQKLISASGGAQEETDGDFSLVTSLYHCDGSNGAQNHTLLDSSSESHTVTRNADIVQGTFSPFSAEEGKWAAEFPVGSASDQINPASGLGSADFALGTGAFTIEAWVFVTGDTYPYSRVWQIGPYFSSNNSVGLAVDDTDNSNKISFFAYAATGSGRTCISTNATPRNEWFHVAVTRDGTGDFRLFVNGNLDSTNTSYRTTDISPLGNPALAIGNGVNRAVEEPFEGFISNFRLVKGTAVYTSSFTVPTEPLTAITNTKLLTCCSNRFRDKSTSAHTITLTGTPRIKPFSPFAPSYSYSASVKGGSGYFDQSSDCYLTVSDATDFDFGTGDYTLEAWVYRDKSILGNFELPFAITGGNNYWGWTDLGVSGYDGLTNHVDTLDSNSGNTADVPRLYEWTHLVYQVTSGNNNWYKNGVRVYNGSANTHSSAATGFQVGRSPSYANHYYGGYISDVRIVKGSNVYSNASTLTVPTAPLTAVTNTKLLLNFTNAAIFDQTSKTNIDTVGNAQLDTSVKKFGTASAEFDGTGDYLEITPGSFISFGEGDFTIELFFNSDSFTGYKALLASANYYNAAGSWLLRATSATSIAWASYNASGANEAYKEFTVPSMSTGTWYHLAAVRSSGSINIYLNGTVSSSGALSDSKNLIDGSVNGVYVGSEQTFSANEDFDGYIDELRITKKARYTSNFTAPTKAFPNL
jgi:hypothetical protein